MSLSTVRNHSKISHYIFLYFITFHMVPICCMIFIQAIVQFFYHPSSSSLVFSISIGLKSDLIFNGTMNAKKSVILVTIKYFIYQHPITFLYDIPRAVAQLYDITGSLYSNITCFYYYSFALSFSLNTYLHVSLPTSCILSQMYFLHKFPSTFISRFTNPFTLDLSST